MNAPTPDGDRSGVTLVVLAAGLATRYGGVKPLAPVGLVGEAVLDVLISDALAAGFERFVLVVGPETGPAIRYHVARTWPKAVRVELALQGSPRGTVDAVVAAAPLLEPTQPFGVANADDLPGEAGLHLLAQHLREDPASNAIVCFDLLDTLVGSGPVTRGICTISEDGYLLAITERRKVARQPDGVVATDGRTPESIPLDSQVNVNLWGFSWEILAFFEAAMELASTGGGEVLLPEVISGAVASGSPAAEGPFPVKAFGASGRCIGVTHPGDVALVQAELAREVARGDRAAQLWTALARSS